MFIKFLGIMNKMLAIYKHTKIPIPFFKQGMFSYIIQYILRNRKKLRPQTWRKPQ